MFIGYGLPNSCRAIHSSNELKVNKKEQELSRKVKKRLLEKRQISSHKRENTKSEFMVLNVSSSVTEGERSLSRTRLPTALRVERAAGPETLPFPKENEKEPGEVQGYTHDSHRGVEEDQMPWAIPSQRNNRAS